MSEIWTNRDRFYAEQTKEGWIVRADIPGNTVYVCGNVSHGKPYAEFIADAMNYYVHRHCTKPNNHKHPMVPGIEL